MLLICVLTLTTVQAGEYMSCVDAESPRIIHLYNTVYYTYYCIIHNTQDFPLYYGTLRLAPLGIVSFSKWSRGSCLYLVISDVHIYASTVVSF